MSYGFKLMVEGDYASFNRPELKVERVSYDVPTPGALEGMLKSVYWKPALRYVVDKIIVFNPIDFINVRRNEVKDKVQLSAVRAQMKGREADPCIYAQESRSQRAAMILKNVRYGVEFHFELTGLQGACDEQEEAKHYNILKRRLENGQYFRTPCLGCSEFPVRRLYLVEDFDLGQISCHVLALGDVDLGYMLYKLRFRDQGRPADDDWEQARFSDAADAVYYRPHMIGGVIDVAGYGEGLKC